MHTTENDHIGRRLGGLLRETERIADVIRHVLNLRHLIVMREDDGVQLFLERENFLGQRIEPRARHGLAEFQIAHSVGWHFDDIGHANKLPAASDTVNVWFFLSLTPGFSPVMGESKSQTVSTV